MEIKDRFKVRIFDKIKQNTKLIKYSDLTLNEKFEILDTSILLFELYETLDD